MRNRVILRMLFAIVVLYPVAMAEEEWDTEPLGAAVDVALDPGHSDADVGAARGGLRETDLTLRLAFMVREELAGHGLSVTMTREDGNPLTDLWTYGGLDAVRREQEARIAAAGRVRAYVSLHFNGHPDPRVRGAEVYYNGDNHGDESLLLGRLIHESVLEVVRGTGYPLQNRGVKEDLWAGKPYGHFFSLRGDLPSVLVEPMFLSNPEEATLLAEEELLPTLAGGIARGIVAFLSQGPAGIDRALGEEQPDITR